MKNSDKIAEDMMKKLAEGPVDYRMEGWRRQMEERQDDGDDGDFWEGREYERQREEEERAKRFKTVEEFFEFAKQNNIEVKTTDKLSSPLMFVKLALSGEIKGVINNFYELKRDMFLSWAKRYPEVVYIKDAKDIINGEKGAVMFLTSSSFDGSFDWAPWS